jgi:high-affinity nickel-transport protein
MMGAGEKWMTFDTAPLGLLALGLTLGMRHATDPDHVVAVTAILTRERRLSNAIRVGLVWGLGHSATVLTVGTAIVLFKLRVPARLGLSLEFLVALVLILLGLRAAKDTLVLISRKLRLTSAQETTLVVHSHPHIHQARGRSHAHHHPHAHSASGDQDLAAHDHLMSHEMAETIAGRSSANRLRSDSCTASPGAPQLRCW